MVALNKVVDEYEFRSRAVGVDQTTRSTDGLTKSQTGLAKATDAAAASDERAARRTLSKAEALAKLAAQNERQLAVMAAVAASNDAVARSLDQMADAQDRAAKAASDASRLSTQAANDNAQAAEKSESILKSLAKSAIEHPTLAAAGLAVVTAYLSRFSATTSTALGTASTATAKFAVENTAMGSAVSSAATLAARGLGIASEATAFAGTKLDVFSAGAKRVATETIPFGSSLLAIARNLGVLPVLLTATAVGFAAVAAGAVALSKARDDFDKLIALGKRAEDIDISAPFLKSFTGLSEKLRVELDQMEAALDQAAKFVRDQYGQANQAGAALGTIGADGGPLRASKQFELAQGTEERIRAVLAGMVELEARGQRLAALDLGEKVFGTALIERLRRGEGSITKFAADLETARGKELLRQEDVARAVEIAKGLEDVRRELREATGTTLDFSSAAAALDGWWLSVLKRVRDVVVASAEAARTGDVTRTIQGLQDKIKLTETVGIPAAVNRRDAETVQFLQGVVAGLRAEIDRLSQSSNLAGRQIEESVGRIEPALRPVSDEFIRLSQEAENAKNTIPGLDGALSSVASAAGNAAAKIGSVADALRALQGLNPNLSGVLGYLDKVGQVQAVYSAALKKADEDFAKSGDEAAATKAKTAALDEQKRTLEALNEQRNKPVQDYVRQGELSQLSDVDRALGQNADNYDRLRKAREEENRAIVSRAATPEDAVRLKAQGEAEIAKLDNARKLLDAKTRADAAARSASSGGGGPDSDALDNAIQRTKDQIDEFELQAQTADKASEEVYKLTKANELWRASRQAGRADEAGMADLIDRTADAYAKQKVATEKATEAQRQMQEGIRSLGDDFTRFFQDVLFNAGKFEDAFASMARSLASSGLQALLTGQGPLAGLLGTASDQKGEMGGLLGGQMPRIFKESIRDGAQEGTAAGAAAGTTSGFQDLFTGASGRQLIQGAAGLAMIGGGFIASQKQGGLMGAASGAISGAMGGAMLGSMVPVIGTAVGAVVGGLIGAAGSLFGKSDAEKQAEQAEKQRKEQAKANYEQNQRNIELLGRSFRGEATGGVEQQIEDAKQKARDAEKIAREANHQGVADRLERDLNVYIARVRTQFAHEFKGMLADLDAGLGLNGPFARAAAAMRQFGESLKGFVNDAEEAAKRARGKGAGGLGDLPPAVAGILGKLKLNGAFGGRFDELLGGGKAASRAEQSAAEARLRQARLSAQQAALGQLGAPVQLSAVATRMREIAGTGAALKQVLVDLGMSATAAAKAIRDRTKAAIDALRESFNQDIGRKLNDANGKGYLNDAADLVKEIATARSDAKLVGGDRGKVEAYYLAAAQKIIDESQLTGAAFKELAARFPDLKGRLHEFSEALNDAADRAAIAARKLAYQDRAFAAGLDTSTKAGALAAFDRQAQRQREEETKNGGQAMADLEKALAAERLAIVRDFAKQAADAEKQRLEAVAQRTRGYGDRLFAANNDTSTLAGQLAAFDRQAAQERADEIKAGGEAIRALEKAQAAERLKIIRDFNEQAAASLDNLKKTITDFVNGLRAGSNSPLAPVDRLSEANRQFEAQYALAQRGDAAAMGSITNYASTLLDASKAYNASSAAYQADFERVTRLLLALPLQVQLAQAGALGPGASGANDNLSALPSRDGVDMPPPTFAGGDAGATVSELKALRAELAKMGQQIILLKRQHIAANKAGDRAIVESIEDVAAGQERARADARADASRPKSYGTRKSA